MSEKCSEGTPTNQELAIQTSGLTKTFRTMTAVDRMDLSVKKGTFFGFLGPNGAGKTTTIKMLTCLLRPTYGTAKVLGMDILRDQLAIKSKIGIVPEESILYERLTGMENLLLVGRLYGMEETLLRRRAENLLSLFELNSKKSEMVVDYSHGMQKKVALGCALIHDPQILFLDEPFMGLDPASSKLVRELLTQLTKQGVTIFLCSHVLDVVEKLCTEVAIINKGRIVGQGSMDEIRAEAHAKSGTSLEDAFLNLVHAIPTSDVLSWMK